MPGVGSFEELDAYKLAVDLRREVVRLLAKEPGCRDFQFANQIRNAARGGPRNIAEGFSRFVPAEFRHFLSYAKASIDETRNHIIDGHESGYFTEEEYQRLETLARRTLAAIRGLMRYLDSRLAIQAHKAVVRARRGETPHPPSRCSDSDDRSGMVRPERRTRSRKPPEP